MDTNKALYTNASVIIGGTVCAVIMVNGILRRMSGWNGPSVFPGFQFICSLCFPILYFWVGMLLRAKMKDPEWWFQLLLAVPAVYCLYCYGRWGYYDALYLSMAGLGFMLPPKTFLVSSRNRGWITLAMILLSAFCYSALETVRTRLLWGALIPEHPDMERMMETILVIAEPLMIIISIYFVAQFALSEVAQKLGSHVWFRWIVALPCFFAFLVYLGRAVYYCPPMQFVVQPVTVYLTVFIYRLIKEQRKQKEERMGWKELAKL